MTEAHGSTATPERGGPGSGKDERPNLLGRIALFYRQIVAELRKVIWPTRHELVTYTTVVVVFVTINIAIVFSLDWIFGQAVLKIFG
jgi:preprotein translocase subunit SecE